MVLGPIYGGVVNFWLVPILKVGLPEFFPYLAPSFFEKGAEKIKKAVDFQ